MNRHRVLASGVAILLATGVCRAADTVTLAAGRRTVLEYRQTPNPNKVYVAKLYSPAGVQVLLDSPPDHVHHHGLMFALEAGGVSFWVDGPRQGVQKPKGPAAVSTDGSLEQALSWDSPGGQPLLEEQRRIGVADSGATPATLVSWTSRLAVPAGGAPVPLTTTRSYVGLGFRFPKSMDRAARFLFPDPKEATPARNTETVTRDRWCACVGPVDGKTVTVAMFSHRGNYRHPASWFTMSDSLTYMTATLNLYRQPLTLTNDRPLELTYGIAVWDGEAGQAAVEDVYRRWTALTPSPAAYAE